MARSLLSSIDADTERILIGAVISYFLNENDKLGLDLNESQIVLACRTLLSENDSPISYQATLIGDQPLSDACHKKELAGTHYPNLISQEFRKQLGQYSTSKEIVRYIIKTVGYKPSREIIDKTIIDPACGSGAFLVEATRIYLNALKRLRVPIYEWYPKVRSAIVGIDIDPKACFFARLNLAKLLAPAVLEFAERHGVESVKPLSVCCDDTLALFSAEGGALFCSLPKISLKLQFDFVVGNPPSHKIKGLSDELKNAFAASIYGHPNAYGLFLHAGIGMLKDSGRLGFIVPRSMLAGLYFKNLRSFIEKETSIHEIVYFSDRRKVPDSVLHGAMILTLEKKRQDKGIITVSFPQSIMDMSNSAGIAIDHDSVIRLRSGTTVWFVADSPEIYEIINRIISKNPLLSCQGINCIAKTGQIIWNRVKPLLAETEKPDTLPLVWATDVGKYSFLFNRMGTARPSFLEVMPKTEGLIARGQSILIQRVTTDKQPSRIIACIPEEFCVQAANGYFVENHLNIIQAEDQAAAPDLFFILGVLNSKVTDFFFRLMNRSNQVSATELNLLPIPSRQYAKDIAALARMIQKTSGVENNEDCTETLNKLVAKAYGLSDKDYNVVKEYLLKMFGQDNGAATDKDK